MKLKNTKTATAHLLVRKQNRIVDHALVLTEMFEIGKSQLAIVYCQPEELNQQVMEIQI